MGGYIGATAVGLVTTAADVQGDITSTDTTPEVILKNTTETDADGSRDGKITFKGEQSGGEESTLAQIQSSHDGTADDQKGDLIFKTNDGSDGASPTERLRIDSSGVVILGHDDATNGTFASGQKLQMVGTDFVSSSFGISRFSADGSGPSISLSKSRSGSIGTDTVVQDNDDLGSIIFSAADGTDLATQGAVITAEVDGTPGGNDLPTRLTISTTGDGNSSPTERMRVKSDGDVTISDGNLVIGTTGHGIDFSADSHASGMQSEVLDDYEEGVCTLTWTGTGGTNNSTNSNFKYVKVGSMVSINGSTDSAIPNATGTLGLTGLPFAANGNAAGAILFRNVSAPTNQIQLVAYVGSTSTEVQPYWAGSVNYTRLTSSHFNSSVADMYFSINYRTT